MSKITEAVTAVGVIGTEGLSILNMLAEEERRLIEEEGLCELDARRLYQKAIKRFKEGVLGNCENCGGIIDFEGRLLKKSLFETTCSDKCSFSMLMEALQQKIHEVTESLPQKRALADGDLTSNEHIGSDDSGSFCSQDINVNRLENTEKLLNRLHERRAFLANNPEEFNVCLKCEEEIPLDRLITSPESGLCCRCKENSRALRTNGRSTRISKGAH